ncbi:MAG: DUF4242 domain-containing protein [Chloroflexi bacterium]|nr:DUF4242 domain-containing protein [Chloroflexota bacterium]MDA1148372.1 DUF4242 domain-containing protein [Chloroflexota bacterium]
MTLYMIERDFTDFSQDAFEAAAMRSKMCVPWVDGLEWIRSFHDVDAERTLCIYRANNEEDVRTHAHIAGIPCGTILPVDEITPDMIDAPAERTEATIEAQLVTIDAAASAPNPD